MNYKTPTSFKRSHTEFSPSGNTGHLEIYNLNLLDCKVSPLSKIGKDTGKVSGSSVTIFICMSRYRIVLYLSKDFVYLNDYFASVLKSKRIGLSSVYLRNKDSKCAKNNIQISVDSRYHTGPNVQQWKPQVLG